MSGSLRDQLLKVGLVNEKQAKKADQAAYKKRQPKKNVKKSQRKKEVNPEQVAADKAQMEKAAQDRELNFRIREKADRKAAAAEIKQMIEKNRLKKEEGDAAFNFADGRKIKRLHLTKELHAQLTKGTLAIVKLGDQYELVTPEIAKKIAARDD